MEEVNSWPSIGENLKIQSHLALKSKFQKKIMPTGRLMRNRKIGQEGNRRINRNLAGRQQITRPRGERQGRKIPPGMEEGEMEDVNSWPSIGENLKIQSHLALKSKFQKKIMPTGRLMRNRKIGQEGNRRINRNLAGRQQITRPRGERYRPEWQKEKRKKLIVGPLQVKILRFRATCR